VWHVLRAESDFTHHDAGQNYLVFLKGSLSDGIKIEKGEKQKEM